MTKLVAFPALLLMIWLSVGCASAGRTTKDATVAAGQEVGDKTEDVAEKVGDKTSDATITAAVKMKFAADKAVDALKIDVDTNDKLVTLTHCKQQSGSRQGSCLGQERGRSEGSTPRLTMKSQ